MGDFAIVGGFEEGSVWGAFAGGVEAVAGVEEDLHVVGDDSFGIPETKVIKKVAEISLSDQILLFIVQREAIVDITGTLRVQR